MSASTAISSGSTPTKLIRSFRASRSRRRSLPNSRKKRARCSPWSKSNGCPNRPRARTWTAPRPRNCGNRSPRVLDYRSDLTNQKSSENRGTTWLLSAAIICVSLVAFLHLREVVQRFGLIPAQATRLYGLTFVTSFFLHAGIIHLAGNMYFLLAFGHAVENFLRPLRYVVVIALAAIVGDLAHIALYPGSLTPCIGVSGGIAGVITFYALILPQMRLTFLMRWGFVWFHWIRLPAWFVFVLWILFQLIGTLEQKAGMSSVSSAAHLGGAAVGILAWLVWRKPNEESRLLK